MLAKTVHVVLAEKTLHGAVKLRKKEFIFRVDKTKLSSPLQPGMLAFSFDGQLVYVLEVMDDCTEDEEAMYTGVLTKVFADGIGVMAGVETEDLAAFQRLVYVGHVVELVDKKFKKTDKILKFRSSEKIYRKIAKGDIVPIVLHRRDGKKENYYVLIQRLIKNASQKQRFMNTKRRPTSWFYQKTEKGYKKTKYAEAEIQKEDHSFVIRQRND